MRKGKGAAEADAEAAAAAEAAGAPAEPGLGFAVEDQIATIVIDAPARGNALDRGLLVKLLDAIEALPESGARVAVLTGKGDKSFSTGYDVQALTGELQKGASVQDIANHPLERTLRAIDASPVPILAMVNGSAYGAGCELAAACDIRIVSEAAEMCMPPARLGLLYSPTGLKRFIELAGIAGTKELFLTGAPISAARAREMGLANRVVPPARLVDETYGLARQIAANAPLALAGTKRIINQYLRTLSLSIDEFKQILDLREACFRSADFQEGTRAFQERRKPKFTGR